MEVPFYFKSIVDAMNVDIGAIGGTAYTVAGSMIIACKGGLQSFWKLFFSNTKIPRRCYQNRSYPIPRATERSVRKRCPEGHSQGRAKCF